VQIDRQELQDYYAALPDEELLDLDRTELTAEAQKYYDAELAKRRLTPEETEGPAEPRGSVARLPRTDDEDEDQEGATSDFDTEAEPDWLENAACAISYTAYPGGSAAADAEAAREVLLAAGIPCHISVTSPDPPDDSQPRTEYRVMVPGARNLEATSVLDTEIFNPREEALWRAHFEALSDKELRALSWEAICAGLRDRLERLKRAYGDEIARRRSR
jgi:hypothetical protein